MKGRMTEDQLNALFDLFDNAVFLSVCTENQKDKAITAFEEAKNLVREEFKNEVGDQ